MDYLAYRFSKLVEEIKVGDDILSNENSLKLLDDLDARIFPSCVQLKALDIYPRMGLGPMPLPGRLSRRSNWIDQPTNRLAIPDLHAQKHLQSVRRLGSKRCITS